MLVSACADYRRSTAADTEDNSKADMGEEDMADTLDRVGAMVPLRVSLPGTVDQGDSTLGLPKARLQAQTPSE